MLRLAGQEANGVHAVGPDVHQRATVELGAKASVVGAVHGGELKAEGGADEPQASDRAFGDEFAQLAGLWMVTPHEAFGEDEARRLGAVERLLHLFGPTRERLLAEHVLPRLEGPQRPLHVQRVRKRDVDRIHVRVSEQRVIAPVRALDAMLAGIRLRTRGVTTGHGDHRDPIGLLGSCEHETVDPRGREEPPGDSHSDGSSLVIACSSSLRVAPVMIATASGIVCD